MEWINKLAAMDGMEMAFPFLDRDVIAFLLAIPGEIALHQGIPKALLRLAMRGTVPEAVLQRRQKADFTHWVNRGARADFHRMIRMLREGRQAVRAGYLDEGLLDRHAGRLWAGLAGEQTSEWAWDMTELLGLELWLKVFSHRRSSDEKRRDEAAQEEVSAAAAH